jgi:hypothetical protein
LEVWFRDDKDGSVHDAYNDMIKKLGALRAADNLMKVRNEVAGQYRTELYRVNASMASELNALEVRVNRHITADASKT